MDWLINAFWARIGWALGEIALFLAALAIVALIAFIICLPRAIRQHRCKHQRFHETGSCNAICTDCGKDLGFIGAWRDKTAAVSHT